MNKRENLNVFIQFLGYGNLASKIWFIGIEEGGNISDEKTFTEELNKRKENRFLYLEESKEKTQVWDIIATLIKEVMPSISRTDMFREETSSFFLSNLFPLPRPTTLSQKFSEYKPYFGEDIVDPNKYQSIVRSERYPIIYRNWIKYSPKLTICFGSGYHNEFENLLKLGHSKFDSLSDGNLFYFSDEKVLLTPFFNYRILKDQMIREIKKVIKECV